MLEAMLLGLIQGLTEFLPVSSSGHLVLAAHLIPGWQPPGVVFDLALHVGTLCAVLVYYRRDLFGLAGGILRADAASVRYVGLLVAGSVPTALIGFSLKDTFEALFLAPAWAAGFLLVTAAMMAAAHLLVRRADRRDIGWLDAVVVGVFQGLAITPGISRSGSTITGALLRRIEPIEAARFSFLLSIPAVGGAALLKSLEGGQWPPAELMLSGALTSFVSGYLAIALFVRLIGRGRFLGFSIYAAVVGLLGLWHFAGGGG
jgi:undecaprenyl-diphosphatase